jgi:hypothetical protein
MTGRWWCVILFSWGIQSALVAASALAASAGDPVAILTEIKAGQGEVRVRPAAGSDWKAPLPLLSLRPGDQIRVTQNAMAVLMFTGGQGTVTVSPANSPYTVHPPPAGAPAGTGQGLVANVGRILAGKKRELTYVPLAVRGTKQPPVLLSPRDGKLLGAPTLEWAGSDRLRYTVRVLGPQGLIWEQANLPRAPLPYPSSAPPLLPGAPYRWELEARDFPAQRGQFTILSPGEIGTIHEALIALEPAALPGYSKNTVVLMRVGFLFEQGLYADARRELLAALAADPDEPALHLMLGHVYEQVGLKELAAEEFDEAQFLVSSSPPPRSQ